MGTPLENEEHVLVVRPRPDENEFEASKEIAGQVAELLGMNMRVAMGYEVDLQK